MKVYWLLTSDPRLILCVPLFADTDIAVVDLDDPLHQEFYEPPAAADFRLVCTLRQSALCEAVEAARDWSPGLQVNMEVMAITHTAN